MRKLEINSGYIVPLSDINTHFKVSAGPGAGKTYWLANHIKNVLTNSTKLGKTKKILCITYTNIAVESLIQKLGGVSTRVEVCTIHSFLYKHVIKPYVHFIADQYELNWNLVRNHDDYILQNYSFIMDWKISTKQLYISDEQIAKAFDKMFWQFEKEKLIVKPSRAYGGGNYNIKTKSYYTYKQMAWKLGVLHHDDVLFFAYQLQKQYPFIAEIVARKFPYIFIDEFQDSNPIQVRILKNYANASATIGVIGDPAQMIYSFQGTTVKQYKEFTLPNMTLYNILQNRRSTDNIVCFLNKIRGYDFIQSNTRNLVSSKPQILIGEYKQVYKYIKELNIQDIQTLTRNNNTLSIIKTESNIKVTHNNLIDLIKTASKSNIYRGEFIINCITALEYGRKDNYKEALRYISRIIKCDDDHLDNKICYKFLQFLMSNSNAYLKKPLLEFANLIISYGKINIDQYLGKHLDKIKIKITNRGGLYTVCIENTLSDFLSCVNLRNTDVPFTTIHQAKGSEFNNVLIVFDDFKNTSANKIFEDFLEKTNLENNEEHRIYYVAISRARNNLFMAVPTLSTKTERFITENYDLPIIRL